MNLPDQIHSRILSLTEQGDNLIEQESFDKAILRYNEALQLVPLPKEFWEASTWIYTAIGDAYFLTTNFKESYSYFMKALNCPKGITNPFISLRIGQNLFELNQISESKEYLLRAYMLEGKDIFSEDDGKYFEIISSDI